MKNTTNTDNRKNSLTVKMAQKGLKSWGRSPLLIRTFIQYIAIIILVIIFLFLFLQGTIRSFYTDDLEHHLFQVGNALEPRLYELFDKNNIDEMDKLLKNFGKQTDIRVTVINPSGTVLADSDKPPQLMENHRSRPEIARALDGETRAVERFSTTTHEEMMYLAKPVLKNSEVVMVIRLSLYLTKINQLFSTLKEKLILAFIAVFFFLLFMAWLYSRSITRPLKDISSAVRELALGNFETKIYSASHDELGEMAHDFNDMIANQKSLFVALTEHQAELHAIMSSIKEGLLVITSDDKIKLCNKSFEELSGKADLNGHLYWEALRLPHFGDCVKKAFDSKLGFYEQFELDNNHYLVGFNPMEKEGELVIIFRDITQFKQLEQMKKDFVVNLTHELKTPLTAIKGFIETLEEEEKSMKKNPYMEIIKRHTERMNRIVSDLLTLSELEEPRRETDFELLDLDDMANNILKIYIEKIKEKNLQLEVAIPKDLPLFRGERFKMEQFFINLIDNAVKYTEKGKITLLIAAEEKEGISQLKIQVKNTGLPIPEKSLPRLFERFYVVDKSRSRKLGGTGLGLSIVKHVVLLHKGSILVQNIEGEGVVFTAYFPS